MGRQSAFHPKIEKKKTTETKAHNNTKMYYDIHNHKN